MKIFSNDKALTLLYNLFYKDRPCDGCKRTGYAKRFPGEGFYRCSCGTPLIMTKGSVMFKTKYIGAWLTVLWLLSSGEDINSSEVMRITGVGINTSYRILSRIKKSTNG